jgi:gliding motility-associated-like protein
MIFKTNSKQFTKANKSSDLASVFSFLKFALSIAIIFCTSLTVQSAEKSVSEPLKSKKTTIPELSKKDRASTINSGDTVVFDYSQAVFTNGNLKFPVSIITDDPDVYALDFQFRFNNVDFTYDTVLNTFNLTELLGNFNPFDLKLRVTSFDFDAPLPNNTNLVTLSFNTTSSEFCALNPYDIVVFLNGETCSYKVIGCLNVPANAGIDQNICAESTFLTANSIFAGTASWSVISGSGTFANPNQPATSVSGLSAGANVFRWTFPANSNTPETFDEVTIFRNLPPSVAIAGVDYADCANSTTLPAEIPSIGTGAWTLLEGTGSIQDFTDPNSLFTFSQPGFYELEWRTSSDNCPESADTIRIEKLESANAGADIFVCESQITLSAIPSPTYSGYWSVVSGTGVFSDSTSATTNVSALSPGENIFSWTLSGSNCPDDSTDFVSVTITCNISPVVTNDSLTTNEDESFTGNILLNGDYDPDSTTLLANVIPLQDPLHGTITVNPDGSYTYTPTLNYYGLDTVIIEVCDQGIPLPVVCQADTLFINVLPINDAPIVQNENLNVLSGVTLNGNVLLNDTDIENTLLTTNTTIVDDANNGTFTINSDGTFSYTSNIGFNGIDTIVVSVCDSGFPLPQLCVNDTIFILVTLEPFTVSAGDDASLCVNSFTLTGSTPPANATVIWEQIQGTGTISSPLTSSTLVSNLSLGVNEFRYSVTIGNITQSDSILITVIEQPSLANAGVDQTVCGDSTLLEAVNPTIGSGTWSSVNSSLIFADVTNYQTSVSNLSFGVDTLIWTTSNGICSSVDSVFITSLVQPQAFAGLDTVICDFQQPLTIPISITGSTNWTWTTLSGNAEIDNELSLFPTFNAMSLDQINSFELLAKNGDCGAYDTLNIFVYSNESEYCKTEPIFIPEGFSPNGDGSYDEFEILNLNGLNADVKIFNRWGILVYSNENYQNDWTGIANQGLVVYGEELPAGTYFYIIQIEGEAEPRKDYLTLWR